MRLGFVLLAIAAMALPARAEPRPFKLIGGQIVVTAKVDGHEIPALLDTGASQSLIETGFARELGIKLQKPTGGTYGASGRKVAYGRTEKLTLDVGDRQTRQTLGFYEAGGAFVPEGIRLMIGMDALRDAALTIDFDLMTVEIVRSSGFTPPAKPGLLTMLDRFGRHTVRVGLHGADANLVIDTAASGSLHLAEKYVRNTEALDELPASTKRITGIDGSREQAAIILPEVKLGGLTFKDVPASVAPLGPLSRGSDRMDGVVGVALLQRFNLVIDYGRNQVWMTPR